jgi:hypothetical protein
MAETANRRRGGRNTNKRQASQVEFWGREDNDDVDLVRPADDPTALVQSLGRPPLPGVETIAEHYFAAMYDRAAMLARALAAASNLLDDEDDELSRV